MNKDEMKKAAKATWIQLSKDKTKGIVYEIGAPKETRIDFSSDPDFPAGE